MVKKLVFLMSFLFLITGLAMAGTVELPKTGQTTSYAEGDDGDLEMGVAWPDPRFTVSGDCVTDNLTGLMWAKNANTGGWRTWQGALDYVASLNSGGGLGGYTDWRLPNVNELKSLINAGQANPASWLNSQGFTNVQANFYWSSTTYAYDTDGAWVVNMYDGYVGAPNKGDGYYVWPVRSGQSGSFDYSDISVSPISHEVGIVNAVPAALPKTGQTTSYAEGDDGDLQQGVAWPNPRFTLDGDCVTDNLTGLMWAKNANAGGWKTWQGALDYVASINNGEGLGGHHDWRLPNRKELSSLISYGWANSATWLNGQGFINVQADLYWSSTTYANDTDGAWIVVMYDGVVLAYYKSSYYCGYVWPVRSGQSGSLDYSDISVSPTTHDFGNVKVGESSAAQGFTITNNGTADLVISSIALTGGDSSMFSVAADPVPNPVTNPVPDTGQTQSYTDTFGEDSDYSINPQSYTKLDAQGVSLPDTATSWAMVRDNVTGLVWEGKTDDGSIHDKDNEYSWYDAQDLFIKNLNDTEFGGFADWRMPTVKELSFIVDSGRTYPAINTDYFPKTVYSSPSYNQSFYWSSTTLADRTYAAWAVQFSCGGVSYYHKSEFWPYDLLVRAVRGGQSGSFDNLIINGGTVADTSTGLMWQQATAGPMTWEQALNYCENLSLGGYDDWRLPNRNELHSLVDYSTYNPAINATAFPDTMSSGYWSSTTYASTTDGALLVYFDYGFVNYLGYKFLAYYVRAVRSGQSGSFDYSDISASQSYYDFGNLKVGESSAVQGFTAGTCDTCPSLAPTIAPGASCTITAIFAPVSAGVKSATLLITSNDPDTPILSVPLSGTGIRITSAKFTLSYAGKFSADNLSEYEDPNKFGNKYVLKDGRAIAPARNLAAYLGLSVAWIKDDSPPHYGKVKFTDPGNGRTVIFEPSEVIKGSSWVLVREVAETFGWNVCWYGEKQPITISPKFILTSGEGKFDGEDPDKYELIKLITTTSRAVAPSLKLAEHLCLKVKWIPDSKLVEFTSCDGKVKATFAPDRLEDGISWVKVREVAETFGWSVYWDEQTKIITVSPPVHVYPDQSIQGAIDAVTNGDKVVVHRGIYKENINFKGKAITLTNTNFAGISQNDQSEATDTIIDGDQIGSVVTFDHEEGGDSVLEGITIRNGKADKGGGIYCTKSSPAITNCIITGNFAVWGAGIFYHDSYHDSNSPGITNCTFTGNEASGGGGGIACHNSSPKITNCILWDDFPGEIEIYLPESNPIATYSDIEVSDGAYPGNVYPGIGNINVNPLFVNPAVRDYHLRPSSPCIDKGSNEGAPKSDKDGGSRPKDGHGYGAAPQCDMGAYEYTCLGISWPGETERLSFSSSGITIKWETVAGADRYWLNIRDLCDGNVPAWFHDNVLDNNKTSYSISPDKLVAGHEYRVAVGAAYPGALNTGDGPWDEVEFFIELNKPSINETPEYPDTRDVRWSSVREARGYWLEVWTEGKIPGKIHQKYDIPESSHELSIPSSVTLNEGSTYKVRVAAVPCKGMAEGREPEDADVSWTEARFTIKNRPKPGDQSVDASATNSGSDKPSPGTPVAEPIDSATGAHILERTLLSLGGACPLAFTVSYNSLLLNEGPLGKGWGHNFEARLEVLSEDIITIHWTANRHNSYYNAGNDQFLSTEQPVYFDFLIKNNDGSYTLIRQDQRVYHFNPAGQLVEWKNRYGQALTMTYATTYDGSGRLLTVTEPVSGHTLTLSYNSDGFIESVTDSLGRQVSFAYDDEHNLTGITDALGHSTTYTYNEDGWVLTATDADGIRIFTDTYDESGRVVTQDDSLDGNEITSFSYDESSLPGCVITTVTNRKGQSQVFIHNSDYRLLSLQDELGYTVTYTYDSVGNRTSATDEAGHTTTYTYDERGNLLTITDPDGHVTTMSYDERNNLLSIENAAGKKTLYIYDANNNLISTTDPLENTTTYTYNEHGLMLTKTTPGGDTTTYTYQNGLLHTSANPVENTVTYSYDAAGRLISTTNAAGKTTGMVYDAADNLISVSDPLGNTISYTYNCYGDKLTETDTKGNTTRFTYDNNGNLISRIDALNNETHFEYDAEDHLIKTIDARGHATTITYDAGGRLIGTTDPLGYTDTLEYDSVGNVISQRDALGNRILTTGYDALRNPISIKDALGRTITNQYDALSRLVQVTDPLEHITQFHHDDLNRLFATTDPAGGESNQEFDENGDRIALIDPGNNRTGFSFDQAGRLIATTFAAGSHTTYSYNSRELLDEMINGLGQVTNYQYDDDGRLISFTDPVGTVSCAYDTNGNLLTVTDGTGAILREYDSLDRIVKYTDAQGNTIRYGYDEAGNLIVVTYPDGRQVEYGYDAADQLISVTDWAGRVTTYRYDANGRLVKAVRPNATILTYSYDVAGQLIQQKDVDQDGHIISQYDYIYDASGKVMAEQSAIAPQAFAMHNATMTYTSDNRMATFDGQAVEYDAEGNMVKGPMAMVEGMAGIVAETMAGAMAGILTETMVDYTYDSRNRLISVGDDIYDSIYAYDAENNRVSSIEGDQQINYVINPHAALSQVLVKTDGEGKQTFYIYGLGLIAQEEVAGGGDGGVGVEGRSVYREGDGDGKENSGDGAGNGISGGGGGNGISGGGDAVTGDYRTYHFDLRGSTIALTDESGQVTDRFQYAPYGELVYRSGTTATPFLYNGRDGVMTDESGLYYMRARYYSPQVRRFVNRDVLVGSVGDGQGLNRYAYVSGEPVLGVDPMGLCRGNYLSIYDGLSKVNSALTVIDYTSDLGQWAAMRGFSKYFPPPYGSKEQMLRAVINTNRAAKIFGYCKAVGKWTGPVTMITTPFFDLKEGNYKVLGLEDDMYWFAYEGDDWAPYVAALIVAADAASYGTVRSTAKIPFDVEEWITIWGNKRGIYSDEELDAVKAWAERNKTGVNQTINARFVGENAEKGIDFIREEGFIKAIKVLTTND